MKFIEKILCLLLIGTLLYSSTVLAQDTPDFTMALYDYGPSSDTLLAINVLEELKDEGYDFQSNYAKLFSEVNGLSLDYQVTLVVYNGETIVVVGTNSPTTHSIMASEIITYLDDKGVDSKAMLSSEITSSDLKYLFEEEKCVDSDGGKEYYEYGFVTEYGIEVQDYCTSNDDVKELYCSNGNSASTIHNCENLCRKGTCLPKIEGLDFNCDGKVSFEDAEDVIENLYLEETTIDINLVTETNCEDLSNYLSGLWKVGVEKIDRELAVHIFELVQESVDNTIIDPV